MADGSRLRQALFGRLGFWTLMPLLLPQGMQVRQRARRFAPAAGPTEGVQGEGPPLRLLAVGDSIVAGVGIPTLEQALTGQLARALAQRCARRVHWRAAGRNGACAETLLRRLLPALPEGPCDLILLSVGVNDVTQLRRSARWRSDLACLLQALRGRHPQAPILALGLPPLQAFPLLPAPLRQVLGWRARWFDRLMREAAAGQAGVRHMALHSPPRPEDFSPDGFHPGIAACRKLGDALAAAAAGDIGCR
jgi:lysophospholipase L1-like esterase